MTITDDPTPEEEAAARERYDATVRRGMRLRRRRRATRVALTTAVVAVALAAVLPVALRNGKHGRTNLEVTSSPQSERTTASSPSIEAANAASHPPPTTRPASTTTTTEPAPTTATQSDATTEPSTVAQPTETVTGPGTANLTFGGVVSGQLLDAVSSCTFRPGRGSDITVNGTVNGTPWVLFVQSYTGENGVSEVLSGQAGGPTGMTGQGYATMASYPSTVPGVTNVDWTRGADLDVTLTSQYDQTPAGDITVKGTISCAP